MLLFLTFFSVTASGKGLDGNAWVENYGKENIMHYSLQGFVLGYIGGRSNSGELIRGMLEDGELKLSKGEYGYGYHLWLADSYTYQCKPKAPPTQIFAIVDKFIRSNPEIWHKKLIYLISFAFSETKMFNCPKEDYKENSPLVQKFINN